MSYIKLKRDHYLDTLRGLMLLLIAFNHLGGPIKMITHEPVGYVSAAEGFVYLSGLVFGLVYSRFLFSQVKVMLKKAFLRVLDIYWMHVGVIFVIIGLSFFGYFGESSRYNFFNTYQDGWFNVILGIALLYIHPFLTGVLPLYIVLIISAPFVLLAFKNKYGYLVLTLSFILWFVNFGLKFWFEIDVPSFIFFNPLSWQFIFIVGMYVGFCRLNKIKCIKYNWFTVVVALIIALVLFLFRHGVISCRLNDILLLRSNIGLIRLVNFFVLTYILGWIISEGKMIKISYLSMLGRHSLEVFSFHIILIYLFVPLKPYFQESKIIIAICYSVLLLLIAFPAFIKEKRKKRMC